MLGREHTVPRKPKEEDDPRAKTLGEEITQAA